MAQVKVLFAGPSEGGLAATIEKIKPLQKKQNFDAVFLVGQLLGERSGSVVAGHTLIGGAAADTKR